MTTGIAAREDSLLKAIGINFLGRVISILTSAVSVRLLVAALDKEGFGIFATITSVCGWLSLTNLGFGLGLQNLLIDAEARNDVLRQRRLVSTTQIVLGVICLCLLTVWVAVYFFRIVSWDRVLNASDSRFAEQIPLAMFWAGVIVLATVYTSYVQAIYAARQHLDRYGGWVIISQIAGFVGLIMAMARRSSLSGTILGYSGCPAIVMLICAGWLNVKYSDRYRMRVADFSLDELRELFKFGGSFTLIGICGALQYSTDNLIISRTLGPAEVASFSIVIRLYNFALSTMGIVFMPFWAAFANAKSSGHWDWVKREAGRLTKLVLAVYLAFMVGMILWGQMLIGLWVGPSVIPSMTLIALLGVYYLIRVWMDIHSTLCNALDKAPITAILAVPAGIATVTVMYVFSSLWGVTGLAIGMCLMVLMTGGWVLPFIAYREINRKYAQSVNSYHHV